MLIKTLPVGLLETNCYVLTDEGSLQCAIIDPGADSNIILDYIEANNLKPVAILITHGHFDHCMALSSVMDGTRAPAFIHKEDLSDQGVRNKHMLENDGRIGCFAEGDVIKVGSLEVNVLETPGHSPGSVTLMCGGALFTGDTLFRDSCGRTDLYGGSMEVLLASLRRLSALDGDFEVYPGHGDHSTLSRERSSNYYVRYANGNVELDVDVELDG